MVFAVPGQTILGRKGRRVVVGGGAALSSALNPADKAAGITLSNGNLMATKNATGTDQGVRSTTSRSSGKYHFEATAASVGSAAGGVGVVGSSFNLATPGFSAPAPAGFYFFAGGARANGVFGADADAWASGDTIAFEVDLDTDQFWVQKVGGTGRKGPYAIGTIGDAFVLVSLQTTGENITVNFGASAFAITPTSGFVAWG